MRNDEDAPAAIDLLRARLLELRADALAQLIAALPAVDTGLLRVVADANAVLRAIEDEGEGDEGEVKG